METALRKTLINGSFGEVAPGDARRMQAVRGKNNKTTERRFRGLLVGAGIRGWKVRPQGLPGLPDFFFPDAHLAIFLDGCFWHACPRCGHVPSLNRPFWSAKLRRNRERDRETRSKLVKTGLRVIRFWEHELNEQPRACLSRLIKALRN